MIEELERLAREAELQMLNGEWWSQHSLRYHLRVADGTCPETDPPYIAACSPDRVLRLLEVVKQAKRVIADLDRLAETGYETEAALRAALAGLEEAGTQGGKK